MKLDSKINQLPLTRTNPESLKQLFGRTDLVPLWVADMEFEIAKPIQKALTQRIQNSGFGYEYKPDSFFAAQKQWYKDRYGIDLEREHILFTPSISTTIAIAIENFSEKGDGVIIQPPVFMEFRGTIRQTNRKLVKNPLQLEANRYQIDFDQLEHTLQSPNNKILIICNPHNPVGRVWKKSELKRIVALCKQYDILLISDEIHKDIVLFDNTFTSVLEFQNSYNKMVVCTSEAKSFNLSGIADAMAIIPNPDIKNVILKTMKKYNLGRTNAMTRVAMETAYTEGSEWLDKLLKTIEQNVQSITTALKDTKINLIKPEGTYQVWLDLSAVYNDSKEMLQDISERSGIAINAGHWFGREGALFMRMNIATSNEKVMQAIHQLKEITLNRDKK